MAFADYQSCFLAGDWRSRLSDVRVGGAKLTANGTATRAEFAVHDTFDCSLTRKGRFLYVSDQTLFLISPEGCPRAIPAPVLGRVEDLPEGAIKQEIEDIALPNRALLLHGRGQVWQVAYALLDDRQGRRADCRVSVFETPCGRPVTHVEIQAVPDHANDAGKLAKRLRKRAADSTLTATAALERLAPGATAYRAKPKTVMTSDMSIYAVANALIVDHLSDVRANEPGILADHDTEFLHDYRVGLKKIRSVLSLFNGVYSPDVTRELKARFATLMSATGDQRDFDVYLNDRPTYLAMVPEDLRPGVDELFAVFQEHRAHAFTVLARHLEGERYLREMKSLSEMFSDPHTSLPPGADARRNVAPYARRTIARRYRKVGKMACDVTVNTPDTRIHALRLQCKKLRYLMEFFAPVFGKSDLKPPLKALKNLQDSFGRFNDCVVQQMALRTELTALSGGAGHASLEMAAGIGGLVTVSHQRQMRERAAAMQAVMAFNSRDIHRSFKGLMG